MPQPEPYVGPRHLWRVDLLARMLLGAVAEEAGPLLDVGCGDGSLALVLARRGRTVLAFDPDPVRLARARARARQAGLAGQVLVFRADAAAIPLPDGCMTGAAAGEVLEHIPRDDLAMGEIARVLATGGAVALTVPAGPGRMSAADRAAGHVRRYDRAGLAGLIENAGLHVVQLRGWGFPFGRLYDRWVQRPALAARGRRGGGALGSGIAWLGRAQGVVALWWRLFALDERLAAIRGVSEKEWGSGWVAVGEPGDRRCEPISDGQP